MHGLDHNMIDTGRRRALVTGGSFGLLGLFTVLGLMPSFARAGVSREAFESMTLSEAFAALGGLIPQDSALISLSAPDVAENGAVVPVTVETSLAGIEQISILVDKNPTMLVASLEFPAGTESFITTRIKMAQTSSVIALVKADGRFYKTSKEVKVTQGGC
ncbi:MAG: thiosulfate oxidation carrier protein SoxY [Sideroxydans sp.]|jgi:sulfur-oxidizing protein SoxY